MLSLQSSLSNRSWLGHGPRERKGEKGLRKVSEKSRTVSLHHKRQGKTDLDWVNQKHELREKNKEPSHLASREWLKVSESNFTVKGGNGNKMAGTYRETKQ